MGGRGIVGGWIDGLVGRWLPSVRLRDFGLEGIVGEIVIVGETWTESVI